MDEETKAEAEAELVVLRADLAELNKQIANAKGEVARRAAEAKKA